MTATDRPILIATPDEKLGGVAHNSGDLFTNCEIFAEAVVTKN